MKGKRLLTQQTQQQSLSSASQHLTWYHVQQDVKDLIEKYKERHDIKLMLNVLCHVYCTDKGCIALAVLKRNHIELNDYRRNKKSEKNSIQIEWQPLVGSLQSHEQHIQTVLETWCRIQDNMIFGCKTREGSCPLKLNNLLICPPLKIWTFTSIDALSITI